MKQSNSSEAIAINADPVAWMVFWGLIEMRPNYPAYNTKDSADLVAGSIKSRTEVRALYDSTTVQALLAAERERCARLCETTDGFRDQREHGQKLAALIRKANP